MTLDMQEFAVRGLDGDQLVELMHIWARNQVGKYKIVQQCRKSAAEMDTVAHPYLRDAWRSLVSIADDLERTLEK